MSGKAITAILNITIGNFKSLLSSMYNKKITEAPDKEEVWQEIFVPLCPFLNGASKDVPKNFITPIPYQ